MARPGLPRIVIAGLAGDAGKTLVTAGIARALARRGWRVAPFKNGPDFIDAAWLGAAARAPGRNLDTWLMPPAAIAASLHRAAGAADIAVVEGKRGLFDGVDAAGTHSTAQLSKLIGAPVVLVVDATKVTRTAAALVLGCTALDPDLALAGVILNRVGTARQEDLLRRAIVAEAGVPVLGAIPRLDAPLLPSRHLGLVCPDEHASREGALETLAAAMAGYVDLEALCALAREASAMPGGELAGPPRPAARTVRIGVLRDAAFSFYYPENLEALEAAGAELVYVSPLADPALPAVDALYAGGGFPEEHAAVLARNEPFRESVRSAIAAGLPVWAECGGLMYLAQGLVRHGRVHAMAGALPVVVEHMPRPQGHGYVTATVDRANPFFAVGTRLAGHEFHHSRAVLAPEARTALAMQRGAGVGGGRDGIAVANAVATYTHLHALATPGWAPALVRAALGGEAAEVARAPVAAAAGGAP